MWQRYECEIYKLREKNAIILSIQAHNFPISRQSGQLQINKMTHKYNVLIKVKYEQRSDICQFRGWHHDHSQYCAFYDNNFPHTKTFDQITILLLIQYIYCKIGWLWGNLIVVFMTMNVVSPDLRHHSVHWLLSETVADVFFKFCINISYGTVSMHKKHKID